MRPSSVSALLAAAVLLTACAPLPPLPPRPDFKSHPGIRDGADKLQTYYNYRLTPSLDGGAYDYGKLSIPKSRLDDFMDHQGDTVAARWARNGDRMIAAGWVLGLALEGAAIALSSQAPEGDAFKNAWWVTLAPAGLLVWTYHWIGDGWFRRPAAAHYDLQLKRELGVTQD